MTQEEAIKLLNNITSYCDFEDEYGDMIDSTPYYEAVDLAIKALEQEPRDCKSCKHSDNGKCAYTEECHECMWESKYEQEPCDDAISKHVVLEAIDSRIEQIKRDADVINKSYSHLSFVEGVYDGYCRLKCDLWNLPSVTPQPKMGRWVNRTGNRKDGYEYTCDSCKKISLTNFKYCPNCGARMEVKE